MKAPPGFAYCREGTDSLLLRNDLRDEVSAVLRAFLDGALPAGRRLQGGRGGARAVGLRDGREMVLRSNLRGGAPALLLRDLYFGVRPRPFRELAVTERLRGSGVRVPESLGALVRWGGPWWYRGAVATQYVPGSANAWERLREDPSSESRRALCARVAEAVDRLHAAGAVHPDLNLTNFLVCGAARDCEVWIVDCDRVRFVRITPRLRRRAWHRLRRSARRLDPGGAVVNPGWFPRAA